MKEVAVSVSWITLGHFRCFVNIHLFQVLLCFILCLCVWILWVYGLYVVY